MLTCGRREPHRSQYLKHSRSSPRKNPRPFRVPPPASAPSLTSRRVSGARPVQGVVLGAVSTPSSSQPKVWYSAVLCPRPPRQAQLAPQLSSAQLRFSAPVVPCSRATEQSSPSAARGCLSVLCQKWAGWLLVWLAPRPSCAYFVARFQVLPGLVSGVSQAGSSTFAAPWHWNATLRLHNCNLNLPARLVPVNCIVATHARHFVCID